MPPLNAVVEAAPQRQADADPHKRFPHNAAEIAANEGGKRGGKRGTVSQRQQARYAVRQLKGRLPFAAPIRRHDVPFVGRQLPESGDEKLAKDDEDCHPERAHPNVGKVDESRPHENFVGKGIKQLAQISDHVEPAGDVAVQKIGGRPQHESPQSDAPACRSDAVRNINAEPNVPNRRCAAHAERYGEEDDHSDSEQRNAIGKIEHRNGSCYSCFPNLLQA